MDSARQTKIFRVHTRRSGSSQSLASRSHRSDQDLLKRPTARRGSAVYASSFSAELVAQLLHYTDIFQPSVGHAKARIGPLSGAGDTIPPVALVLRVRAAPQPVVIGCCTRVIGVPVVRERKYAWCFPRGVAHAGAPVCSAVLPAVDLAEHAAVPRALAGARAGVAARAAPAAVGVLDADRRWYRTTSNNQPRPTSHEK